jgi:surface polysaccharide O-acyltransferase-like enzyme
MQIMNELYFKGGYKLVNVQMLRCVCAVFVIIIHTSVVYREVLLPLTTIAVPLFYMISGYFMIGHDGALDQLRIRRALKKIFHITISANLIYFVYYVCLHGWENLSSWRFWLIEIFRGGNFGWHLWYLTAYLEALSVLLLICVCFKRERVRRLSLMIIALVGFSVNMLSGPYNLWGVGDIYSDNLLTMALPFLFIGGLVRYKERALRGYNWLWISLMCCVLLFVEFHLNKCFVGSSSFSCLFFSMPLAVSVLMLFLTKPQLNINVLSRIGDKYSLDIYIYHMIILYLCDRYIFPYVGFHSVLVVFLLTLMLAAFPHRGTRVPMLRYLSFRNY